MSISVVLFLGALRLGAPQNSTHLTDEVYYDLPRFWTNTGFCPAGQIDRENITAALLSDAVQMNLMLVAALPTGAVTHVRIHWLLELIEFVQYTQAGVPIYDFTNLDTFLMDLDDQDLLPVIEFMANPGDVFVKNPNRNDFLWDDFSYQVVKHYLNTLGASKVYHWRFESWNEPDSISYNKLNFTVEDYLTYLTALRRGLTAAGSRPEHSLYFPLRGPAGLFKSEQQHPLCWKVLQHCSANLKHCPFDIVTYHRKGMGLASEVLAESSSLLHKIYSQFPNLAGMPVSNDEADPIADWSKSHAYQADVRYACTLIAIVLDHWSARVKRPEFQQLESISHDNAFLSYHPHEFSQRTLLAHFRMNNSEPPHSQFVQKPVYAALGLLSKLASLAADVETLTAPNGQQVQLLKTTTSKVSQLHLSWLLLPSENVTSLAGFRLQRKLPFDMRAGETYAFILELLEQQNTDPAFVWRRHGSPAYPNVTVRAAMRRAQTPALLDCGELQEAKLQLNVGALQLPWVVLLRVCSSNTAPLRQPHKLLATGVTQGEVLLTWRELPNATQCLRGYEVWFLENTGGDTPSPHWKLISDGWHLPFPSFQFAATAAHVNVNGFYKVRAIDIFNRSSTFSEIVEYIEY